MEYIKTEQLVKWEDIFEGGIYYRPNGNEPFRITLKYCGVIEGVYLTTKAAKFSLDRSQFKYFYKALPKEPVNSIIETQKETEMKNKLYQVIGTEIYGTLLATNSSGNYVLEVKGGSGELITRPKSEVEEVFPYTVAVNFFNDSGALGKEYQYLSKKGDVEVNDLLVINTPHGVSLVLVTKLDTKSSAATVELVGRKLSSTKVG